MLGLAETNGSVCRWPITATKTRLSPDNLPITNLQQVQYILSTDVLTMATSLYSMNGSRLERTVPRKQMGSCISQKNTP